MARRPLLAVSLAAVFAVVGFLGDLAYGPAGNVTPEAYARIEDGMTEAEVERTLGGPADYYGAVCFCSFDGCLPGICGEWQGEREVIAVSFYEGTVCWKRTRPEFSRDTRPPSLRGPLWRLWRRLTLG